MNDAFGSSVSEENLIKVAAAAEELLIVDEMFKAQALNNSLDQVMNGGDSEDLSKRIFVEAIEQVIEDNQKQGIALGDGLASILSDNDSFKIMAKKLLELGYNYHRGFANP